MDAQQGFSQHPINFLRNNHDSKAKKKPPDISVIPKEAPLHVIKSGPEALSKDVELVVRDHYNKGWEINAACLEYESDLFFGISHGDINTARAICANCVVRISCLTASLCQKELYGVWGGRSARERRTLRVLFKKANLKNQAI